MEFDSFQTLLVDTKVDFDKADGAQCVDLAQYWNRALGNQTPFSGNAIDIFNQTFDGFYEAVANTPEGIPTKGDIVCFNANMGGGNGHVVIANGTGDTNTFQAFSQNDPDGAQCQINTYNYENVTGWLHATKQPENYRANLEACLTQHTDLVNAANEKDIQIGDLNTKLTEAEAKNAELTTQIETLQTAATATNNHVTELEAQIAAAPTVNADPTQVTTETLNQHFPTLSALVTEFKKLMGHS